MQRLAPQTPPVRRFRRASRLVAALAAAGGLAAALTGCIETKATPPKAEIVRPARVVEVVYRDDIQRFSLPGTIAPRYETNLGFRVAGKLAAREVEIGSTVKPGQVLARLDPADYRLAVDNARAALAAAEAEAMRTRADLDRYAQLRGTAAFVPQTLDLREANAAAADGRLAQARTQLATAENNLSYTVLVAASEGVVTALFAEAGQVLAQGQSAMRIARTEELEVAVAVPEHRLAALRAGPAASFELWSDTERRHGAVLRELSPSADPATRTFAARFALAERPAFVGMGMTATLWIERRLGERVAELPITAIYQQGQAPAVWVVDRTTGIVALRPVTILRLRDETALVSAGVAPGELVATAGVHKLEAGQKVRPMLAESAPQTAAR